MDIITQEQAQEVKNIFAVFVTPKNPNFVSNLIAYIEKEPYQHDGKTIAAYLNCKEGYLNPILKNLVKFGFITYQRGKGKAHKSMFYAPVKEKIELLVQVFETIKPA